MTRSSAAIRREVETYFPDIDTGALLDLATSIGHIEPEGDRLALVPQPDIGWAVEAAQTAHKFGLYVEIPISEVRIMGTDQRYLMKQLGMRGPWRKDFDKGESPDLWVREEGVARVGSLDGFIFASYEVENPVLTCHHRNLDPRQLWILEEELHDFSFQARVSTVGRITVDVRTKNAEYTLLTPR